MPARAIAVLIRRGLAATLVLAVLAAVWETSTRAQRTRADFVFTGGGEVRALDPHAATGIPEGRILRALFEGLVVHDPATLQPSPGCASTWTSAEGGRVYTFQLRDTARWSNGDPVVAEDFVWSWKRLLDPATGAEYAPQLWCVEGARELSAGESAEFGARALDARTLEVRLVAPTPRFLDILCFYAFAPLHRASFEAVRERYPSSWSVEWTRPENLVCNGAYTLEERRINERIRLRKSETYWNADAVAMRTIDMLAVESWTSALNLYLTGEVDWVDGAIPSNLVKTLAQREDFHATPYLGVYFYRLNTTKAPLDNARVRRALSNAIDRSEITGKVLKAGQGSMATFVPWGAVGAYRSPPPPALKPGQAAGEWKALGYETPGGKGKTFPTLEIHFNTSETHRAIAEVVAHQWKQALGVDCRLRNQEWKAFLDAQANLDYDVSRSSWIADYADPGNFLEIWTTDNPNNRTGWSNATYDKLIASANREVQASKRNALYAEAEKLLLNEAPCIPIYSYVSQNLIDPRVGGFDENELNEPSLAKLYWRDDEQLAAARRADKRQGVSRAPSHGPRAGLRSPAAERAALASSAQEPKPAATQAAKEDAR